MMENMRLQKYIAHCGYTSRRKAEILILDGRVSLNGKVVTEMGVLVNDNDIVEIDNKRIRKEINKVYILLNKPVGVVSTVHDEFGRKTVLDFLEGIDERVYPVGRLDYGTSGLIILTNDGNLTNFLTHPSHEIEKAYLAEFYGELEEEQIEMFEEGMNIDGYTTLPAKIDILTKHKVRVTIREGKNRQIRKMFEAVNCEIYKLSRIAIGGLYDRNLPVGMWRFLTTDEIKVLGYDPK